MPGFSAHPVEVRPTTRCRIASIAAQQISLPRPMVKVRPWPSSPGVSVFEHHIGRRVVRVRVHRVRAVQGLRRRKAQVMNGNVDDARHDALFRCTSRIWSAESTTSPRWLITSQRSITRPIVGRLGSSLLSEIVTRVLIVSPMMHRLDEPQPVIAIGKRDRIDQRRRQPDADGKNHRAMRDALAARQGLGELRIHVVREEIARMPRMHDEIRLGDRAPGGGAHVPELIFLDNGCSARSCLGQCLYRGRGRGARLVGGLDQRHRVPGVLD